MTWWVAGSVVAGALVSSDASRKVSNTQADAAREASAAQRSEYDQTRTDNLPALAARNSSLSRVQEMLGIGGNAKASGYGSWANPITPQNVQNDPGYQFGLKQGNQNIEGSAAARGGLFSGAAMRELNRYGNDYASSKYGDAYNRLASDQDRQRNALFGVAGLGQTGSSTIAQSGQNMANQIGSNLIGAGNAQGASIIEQGNALQNGVNALGYGVSRGRRGGGNSATTTGWWGGSARYDDPYASRGYFGGAEGE